MKRTWVVYVEMGIGHELQNTISEADWYGPYTESQAEALAARLNAILDDPNEPEHAVARTMPLDSLSPREVVRAAKSAKSAIAKGQ